MSRSRQQSIIDPARREFLRKSFAGMGWMMAGGVLSQCGGDDGGGVRGTEMSNLANLGPLGDPDENGIRLPEGFTSRICARRWASSSTRQRRSIP
jgi:hypothetical protein